jgi:hypothetical protein
MHHSATCIGASGYEWRIGTPMACSRRQEHHLIRALRLGMLPPRTPCVLGMHDAGDPNCWAELGDTPGSVGFQDWGDPTLRFSLLTKPKRYKWQHESERLELHVNNRLSAMEPLVPSPISIEAMRHLTRPRLVEHLRYELIVAINPGVEREGVVQVQDNPGHTVVIATDTETNEKAVLSYGPADPAQLFMMEKTLGDPFHAIDSKDSYTAFTWTISRNGYNSARAYIGARIGQPEVYDLNHQCTTETLEVAKNSGISLPRVKGKVAYSGHVRDSVTPAALLRELKKLAETDPSIKITPVDAEFLKHFGFRVVDR